MNHRQKSIFLSIVLTFFSFLFSSHAQEKTGRDIQIDGNSILLVDADRILVRVDSISFNYVNPSRRTLLHDSEDSVVLRLSYPDVPDFDKVEFHEDHTVDVTITQTESGFHLWANPEWARYLTVYMADFEDHYFGLVEQLYPENRKSPDLRGTVVDVEVFGEGSHYHENYCSVWSAFYMSSRGYASFMDTFARGRYHLAINGQTKIHHETGTLDWYVFTGDSRSIYKGYYQVIGAPKYVPLWACGPVVWRDQNDGGSAEILEDVRQFTNLKIPMTSIMVDRPYSHGAHGWSEMDFGDIFQNPDVWINELNEKYGLEFMTWIAPATFADRSYPGLLPGFFGYMDLTDSAAVAEWFARLNKNQYTYGVKGHKIDRADEHFPASENWSDGTRESFRRNKYAFLFSQITDSMLTAAWGKDQFNYARAAYHRSQPYLSGVWGGDSRTSWDGMASNMANAIRASFMGFPNWGTDVGGYLGETGKLPDALYIRWLQWGAFNGFYEIKYDGPGGVGEDRAPWNCSEEVQKAFRRSCELRMQWIPFIFSKLNTAGTYGTLMKPLAMVFPEDKETYDIWNEYLFGDEVLVAPVFSSLEEREIYFPEGRWIDMNTLEVIEGPTTVTRKVPLEEIPLYVKANSLLVLGNVIPGNSKVWNYGTKRFVDVLYYPHAGGESEFTFVEPESNRSVMMTASAGNTEASLAIPGVSFDGRVKVFSAIKPRKVTVNGKKAQYEFQNGIIELKRSKQENMEIRLVW